MNAVTVFFLIISLLKKDIYNDVNSNKILKFTEDLSFKSLFENSIEIQALKDDVSKNEDDLHSNIMIRNLNICIFLLIFMYFFI